MRMPGCVPASQQLHRNDTALVQHGCMRGLTLSGLPAEPKAAYSVSAVVVGSKPRTCRRAGQQVGMAQSARLLLRH